VIVALLILHAAPDMLSSHIATKLSSHIATNKTKPADSGQFYGHAQLSPYRLPGPALGQDPQGYRKVTQRMSNTYANPTPTEIIAVCDNRPIFC
jgi:hypothetical protein